MSGVSLALHNLRAFVILIVLAFHSLLAYLDFLPKSPGAFDQPPFKWRAFPMIDSHRWFGFDLFCAWQDVYLMSLMFFLSALFVGPSLARKKSALFAYDRFQRLGVPFLFAIVFLMPIALYPTYRVTALSPDVIAYAKTWLALPFWPIGPQWFLWQLLVLNFAVAALYWFVPGCGEFFARLSSKAATRPLRYFAGLACASALGYVPLALAFTSWEWAQFGPFSLQLCRPLHYVVYFFAGIGIGMYGLERGLLARNSMLVKHWAYWLAGAFASFLSWMGFTALTFTDAPSLASLLAADLNYVVACASACLAALALAVRFCDHHWPAFKSIADNAYGMYLLHYISVVWLQYALLDVDMFAGIKALIVFAGTLVASWGLTAALRRVPIGARLVGADRRLAAAP